VLAALLACSSPAAASEASAGIIRIVGQRFVAPDGSSFTIKGIGLGNWLMQEGYMFKFELARSPKQIEALFARLVGDEAATRFWERFHDSYIAEDDIRLIARAGFNTIRVPLHYALFMSGDQPARFEGPGYPLLDRLIGWCRDAGLKVIIDLHAAPGGQTGVNHDDGPGFPLVFYVPKYREQTVQLWRHLAERYHDEAAVLGYDLLNEPISPYLDTDYLNPRLEPLYREIVAAIRTVDPDHPVFLAGAQWSSNFTVFGRPFAPNMAFTYHEFWSSTRRDAIQKFIDFSNRYDVPVFLGESGELNDAWNQAFRSLHERLRIGWSFWTYKNLDSTSSVVSITPPPGWATIVAAANTPPDRRSESTLPSRAAAQATLDGYLEAIKLRHATIRGSYLVSLGLTPPPE
jgi:aryl-phospho-beta-D-glucosidase BglC (GH1 family)